MRHSYNNAQRVITVHTFVSGRRDSISGRYSFESAPLFSQRPINFFIFPLLFCFLPRLARRQRGKLLPAPELPHCMEGKVDDTAHLNLGRDNNRDYGNRGNVAEYILAPCGSRARQVPGLTVTFNFYRARVKYRGVLQPCWRLAEIILHDRACRSRKWFSNSGRFPRTISPMVMLA